MFQSSNQNLIAKINQILIFINLFFLQSYLIRFSIFSYPSNLQEILIGFNFLTFIFAFRKSLTSFNFRKIPVTSAIIILSIISLIFNQTLNSIDLLRHLKFIFFSSILVFIFFHSFASHTQKQQAIRIAGYGALSFGIFAIIYNLFGINVTNDGRIRGPLDSAVYLAFYLAPFVIYFANKFIHTRKTSNLLIFCILTFTLITTQSMGAIAASFALIALLIIKKYWSKIPHKSKLIIPLAIIGSIILYFIIQTKIIPTINTKWSSLDERGQIWQTSYHLLTEPKTIIFGTGLSQFQAAYSNSVVAVLGHPPLDFQVLQPHNIFLLFIFHYGILGLILIIYLILKNAHYLLKSNDKIIWATIFFYFTIHGLIDTPIYKNDLLFLFLLFTELTKPFHQQWKLSAPSSKATK